METIVAKATSNGYAGIGVVRVSGPLALKISELMLEKKLKIRQAEYCFFLNINHEPIDQGIALFFKGPRSFTGEDVLEFQAHGGPVVLNQLIKTILHHGARLARPGEFLERAFLNNKIDLVQAEAIHDLIHANSEAAARGALRSMQGVFSEAIHRFLGDLISLRMYIEAAIDFPDEEIDLLKEGEVIRKLENLISSIQNMLENAERGALLSQGIKVVIAGNPNAGKSSLLNKLSGYDAAIVTDIPGTTRDLLREEINFEGIKVELVDTAGFRESADIIEQEGINRALKEIASSDHLLWVMEVGAWIQDDQSLEYLNHIPNHEDLLQRNIQITVLVNKIDIQHLRPTIQKYPKFTLIQASAKTGDGLPLLLQHLKDSVGNLGSDAGSFSARERHLDALRRALRFLNNGYEQWKHSRRIEILALELRYTQEALDEITGKFSSDDLLGKIFSEFCIGK